MNQSIALEIRSEDGAVKRQVVDPGLYRIGASDDNQIVLPGPEISSSHAILILRPDVWWIEDLRSPAGTFLDDRPVHGRCEIRPGQKIRIGQHMLMIGSRSDEAPVAATTAEPHQRQAAQPEVAISRPPPAPAEWADPKKLAVKQHIHRALLDRLDIKRLTSSRVDEGELHKRVLKTLTGIVKDEGETIPKHIDHDALIKEIYDEAVGLGPLEDLLADPEITEIMVNGHNHIYVERNGRIERTRRAFLDDNSVLAIIERIVSPIGRRIDESQPYVDARLRDGSRVNAIIHPLSLTGPCLTIRKFSKIPFTDSDMIRSGTIAPLMADFLRACVMLRKNIVVSGGTGSGKTTFLNVLSSYLPESDRIITIEDAAELRLSQDHVVRLEARPPNIEGKGAVAIRDLVRNALRMRPDRIVVGECRGGEALDMLQAMNTGHDGSLTTVHANSPRDVISRLETMVLMSGLDLPVRAIREQIVAAIDMIIHLERFSDGARRVVNVTEIVGLEGDKTTMQEIFLFKQTGMDAGRVLGAFMPTGAVPTFFEDARSKGVPFDATMFDARRWPQ